MYLLLTTPSSAMCLAALFGIRGHGKKAFGGRKQRDRRFPENMVSGWRGGFHGERCRRDLLGMDGRLEYAPRIVEFDGRDFLRGKTDSSGG